MNGCSTIPGAHLYNLRNSAGYRRQRSEYTTTRPTPVTIGVRRKPTPEGILRGELQRVWSVDLNKIPGIHTGIAQALLGEIGPGFTKFGSAPAFASWMGLCPDNDISGGKLLFVAMRQVKCRAALALRMAAQSLHHSKRLARIRCRPTAVPVTAGSTPKQNQWDTRSSRSAWQGESLRS